MRSRRALWLLGLAAPSVTAVAMMLAQVAAAPLVIKNVTPSMPMGLYRRVDRPVAAGAIVALRQPPSARPYLETLGFPEEAMLLKRVGATTGQMVCADGGKVWTEGGAELHRRGVDRSGQPLPQWSGCRRLSSDQLFVQGDDPRSFDSRYFGPVARSAVIGVYEPIR